MLACAWDWSLAPRSENSVRAEALAASLCAAVGGKAAAFDAGPIHFAFRPLLQDARAVSGWTPVQTGDGRLVAFHGYLDNPEEIAEALGCGNETPAMLFARAVDCFGQAAHLRIVGEYCAIICNPAAGVLQLVRSPVRAPPLVYYQDSELAAAGSIPGAIFAAGVPAELDKRTLADSALLNHTELERGWHKGLFRVPLGCIVELQRGEERRLIRYYDTAALPDLKLSDANAGVVKVRQLLGEGVRKCLTGSRRPGATLSSGLDSPQVVLAALDALPPEQRLSTYTFHTLPEWDGGTPPNTVGDERAMVEQFVAMHPRIDPEFIDNAGRGHTHLVSDFFRIMDAAPLGLSNMYVFHGIFERARAKGCDLLLIAEGGNDTFSAHGSWGFFEYFRTLRWRQLWLALKHNPHDTRTMARRFIAACLVPLLPDRIWKLLRRLVTRDAPDRVDLISPLHASYRVSSGAEQRRRKAGIAADRNRPRSRREARKNLIWQIEYDGAEIYQAFELIYGIPCRDPTLYRPLVEFCLGLPTDMFLRDGIQRWLAKEMIRGQMPEIQRENRLNGYWDADWHPRIKPRLQDYLDELDRAEADPDTAEMIDIARLRSALLKFPDAAIDDPQLRYPIQLAAIRGIVAVRYLNYLKGRN